MLPATRRRGNRRCCSKERDLWGYLHPRGSPRANAERWASSAKAPGSPSAPSSRHFSCTGVSQESASPPHRGRRGQLPPGLPPRRDPNPGQDAAVPPYSPPEERGQKKKLGAGKSQLASASGPAAFERVWIRATRGCQEAIPGAPTPPSPCPGLPGGSVPAPVPPELRQAPSASPGLGFTADPRGRAQGQLQPDVGLGRSREPPAQRGAVTQRRAGLSPVPPGVWGWGCHRVARIWG